MGFLLTKMMAVFGDKGERAVHRVVVVFFLGQFFSRYIITTKTSTAENSFVKLCGHVVSISFTINVGVSCLSNNIISNSTILV